VSRSLSNATISQVVLTS